MKTLKESEWIMNIVGSYGFKVWRNKWSTFLQDKIQYEVTYLYKYRRKKGFLRSSKGRKEG